MAETQHAQILPHLHCGPVVGAASIPLAVCSPNFPIQKGILDWRGFAAEALRQPTARKSGYVIPPEAPGPGVELDEAALDRHPWDGDRLHLEMEETPPEWPTPDSSQNRNRQFPCVIADIRPVTTVLNRRQGVSEGKSLPRFPRLCVTFLRSSCGAVADWRTEPGLSTDRHAVREASGRPCRRISDAPGQACPAELRGSRSPAASRAGRRRVPGDGRRTTLKS